MGIGKWVLGIAALALLFGGVVNAQTPYDYNRLCIHNGGDYYTNGFQLIPQGQPNQGNGKFYPSYSHWASTAANTPGLFPWKIRGWSWTGMKGPNGTTIWHWTSTLQFIKDDPYNWFPVPSVHMSCTFPAPVAWCQGTLPTSGWQNPIWRWGSTGLPTSLPLVGGKDLLFPSSSTWTTAANIFAIGGGTFTITGMIPYYGYEFGIIFTSSAVATIPSATSIWNWTWVDGGVPPDYQYVLYSGNEMDHHATYPYNPTTDRPGYKGKNQILTLVPPYIVGWPAHNGGSEMATEACLFVDDAVLVPFNYGTHAVSHTGNNQYNPFVNHGFDVATTTMTPLVSDGGTPGGLNKPQFGVTTEDWKHPAASYVVLGSLHYEIKMRKNLGIWPFHRLPMFPNSFPTTWDPITTFFAIPANLPLWLHTVNPGFPACAWDPNITGVVGGPSIPPVGIGVLKQAQLKCKEVHVAGYEITGLPPTASYMVTFF